MKRKALATALFVLVAGGAAAVIPRFAEAAEGYYVTTAGSDSNPGTREKPFATINKFMSVAQPGDTVFVCGGTYDMGETYLTKSGAPGRPITIRNCPGEVPRLDGKGKSGVAFFYGESGQGKGNGSHIVIEGFVITNYWRSGINIGCCSNDGDANQTVSDVVVRNNVVYRAGQNGITFMQAGDVTVENNLVVSTGYDPGTGSWSSNINLYGMHGDNNVVGGNVTLQAVDTSNYRTDGNGIIVDLTHNQGSARIQNNLSFDNGGAGIIITSSKPGTIVNNTTYENGREPTYVNGGVGIGYYGSESVQNPVLRNNIAYQSFGKGLYTSNPLVGATVENNTISGETGGTPQFVDPDNADFRLRDGSAGVDAGTAAGAPGSALVFDPKALKRTTADQPISWYRWAPDLDYIVSRGEVARIFGTNSRPQGAGVDQGAFEGDAAPATPATTAPEPSTSPSGPAQPTPAPSDSPAPVPSSSSPTATPPSSPAVGAQVVYDDAFADGWAGSAWGGTMNARTTKPAYGDKGSSIGMRSTAGWAAVAVSRRGGPMSTAGLTEIRFRVHGGRAGTRALQVMVNPGGSGDWGPRVRISAPAGRWTDVTVPLSALGSPTELDSIAVQLATGTPQPAFYIDDVQLS